MLYHAILRDHYAVTFQSTCPVSPFSKSRGQWAASSSARLRGLALQLFFWDLRSDRDELLDLSDADRKQQPKQQPKQPVRESVSLLKSNLQKCVRRRDVERGMATAHVLFLKDPDEALRRWPVIAVEDGVPTPDLLPVVWLMCARAKGYALQRRDLRFFLASVLACLTDDRCHELEHERDLHPPVRPRDFGRLNSVSQAMWIRSAYGGMPGDMIMLRNAAVKWEGDRYPKDEVPLSLPIDMAGVPLFDASCILPAARDFHVDPSVLRPFEGGPYSTEQVKRAMWFHSSGVIHRKSMDGAVCKGESGETGGDGDDGDNDDSGLSREERFKRGQEATREVWAWMLGRMERM